MRSRNNKMIEFEWTHLTGATPYHNGPNIVALNLL